MKMFSRIRGNEKKSAIKAKSECKCVKVPINDVQDEEDKVINLDCSSHPGFCLVDDSGLCTKQENAPHCSLTPVELIGEVCTTDVQNPNKNCRDLCSEKQCGKRFHSYKIDLNNAEDTGLLADKQCQTCGPFCSKATCSGRSREFLISWDRRRTKLLIIVILGLGLWICIYASVASSI